MNNELKKIYECPVCKSKKIFILHKVDLTGIEEANICKCSNCGLIFLSPQNLHTDLYDTGYYYFDRYSKKYVFEDKNKAEFIYYIINKYFDNIDSVFDIGAAYGIVSFILKKYGYEVNGIEISQAGIDIAKKRFDINLIKSSVEDFNKSIDSDIIVMTDVLEHTFNPKKILNKIYNLISHDTGVIIEVPNINSFYYKLIKQYWVGFNQYHNFYFTSEILKNIAIDSGFNVIDCFTTNFNILSMEGLWRLGIKDLLKNFFNKFKNNINFDIESQENLDTSIFDMDFPRKMVIKHEIKKIVNYPLNIIFNKFNLGDQLWIILKK